MAASELHARYVAEHLSAHADVRVLTTCARDYVTWRNEWASGEERSTASPSSDSPSLAKRDIIDFRDRSSRLLANATSIHGRRLGWLESEGPTSPTLMKRLARVADDCDFLLLFSVGTARRSLARASPRRTVLVPTAERESALGLSIFCRFFEVCGRLYPYTSKSVR